MHKKKLLYVSLLSLLLFAPVTYAEQNGNSNKAAAQNNGGNNKTNNNPGVEGKPGNSNNNRANNNGNPDSQSNSSNGVHSESRSTSRSFTSSTSNFSLNAGQVQKFGSDNTDEVSLTDEDFDRESNDSNGFVVLGIVNNISDDDNTFTLNNGKKFSLTDDQMSFLIDNGLLTTNARVQVNGNNSNNGNVVRIMKIQDPSTGQMIMIRLHTNTNGGVNQFSVKSKGGTSTGILGAIVSFFQNIFGGSDNGGGTPTPTPTPSVSPSPTPTETITPTETPTPTP